MNKLILFSLLIVFSSCNFSSTRLNSPEDLKKGENFLSKFYQLIENRQLQNIEALKSDTLSEVIKNDDLSKLLNLVYDKIGRFKQYKITDQTVERKSNANRSRCLYKYELSVTYEKGTIREIVSFIEDKEDELRILSYNAYSDLLVGFSSKEGYGDGKAFLEAFYLEIDNQNFSKIDDMITDSLRQLAGKNGLSKLVKTINEKVGNYKGHSVDGYFFNGKIDDIGQLTYHYKLDVMYDKGDVVETFGLKKTKSGIKLNSYHANSDLLIK
jgi:hypothetical protein